MTDKHLIILASLVLLICTSHITDMILTAKEDAFAACVHANSAASRADIETICGE